MPRRPEVRLYCRTGNCGPEPIIVYAPKAEAWCKCGKMVTEKPEPGVLTTEPNQR